MAGAALYADNPRLLAESLAGDESATAELIRRNTGLVRSIALRFSSRGYDQEDLIQIGLLGLLKAIRTFDVARGCAFSTYAVPLVLGEIRRFLRDDGMIKISREQKRLSAELCRIRDEAFASGEGELRLEELAHRAGVSREDAAAALEASFPIRSLSEAAYGGDEDAPTLEATLSDGNESERTLDRLALSLAIDKLPPLRKKILLLRYYRDYSQAETAKALGLTQVKISREEKKIIEFLRQELS